MRHYSNNPILDAERTQLDQEEWLNSRPVCDRCGEPIQDDYYFYMGANEQLCEDCMIANYRVPIEEEW